MTTHGETEPQGCFEISGKCRSGPTDPGDGPRADSSRPPCSEEAIVLFAISTCAVILAALERILWTCGERPAYYRRDPYAGFTPQVPHFKGRGERRKARALGHRRPEQVPRAERPGVSAVQAAGYLPDRLSGRVSDLRPAVFRSHLLRRLVAGVPAQGRSVAAMS